MNGLKIIDKCGIPEASRDLAHESTEEGNIAH